MIWTLVERTEQWQTGRGYFFSEKVPSGTLPILLQSWRGTAVMSPNRLGLKNTLAADPDVERHALPRGG